MNKQTCIEIHMIYYGPALLSVSPQVCQLSGHTRAIRRWRHFPQCIARRKWPSDQFSENSRQTEVCVSFVKYCLNNRDWLELFVEESNLDVDKFLNIGCDLLAARCVFFCLTFLQTDEDVASLVSLQLRSFQSPEISTRRWLFLFITIDCKMADECNIKVVCRVRPLNAMEEKAGSKFMMKFPTDESCTIGVSTDLGGGGGGGGVWWSVRQNDMQSLCIFTVHKPKLS